MKYYVAANLNHDRKEYSRGDTITLDETTAQPLVDAGVLSTEAELAPAPVGRDPQIEIEKARAATVSEPVDYDEMTRAQLIELAVSKGIDPKAVNKASKKAALIELIEAADSTSETETPVANPQPKVGGAPIVSGEPAIDPSANL